MHEPQSDKEWGDVFPPKRSKARVGVAIVIGLSLGLLLFVVFYERPFSKGVPDWIPPAPPPMKMSQIDVFSTPRGAKVFLEDGGVSLATTPGVVSLVPGEHTLRFEMPGLPIKRLSLDTNKEKRAQVSWEAAVIKISARPGKVGLLLDGELYGFTPATLYFPKGSTPHEVKACPKDFEKKLCPEGFEEKIFVFQPAHDLEHLFDFSVPLSAPAQ